MTNVCKGIANKVVDELGEFVPGPDGKPMDCDATTQTSDVYDFDKQEFKTVGPDGPSGFRLGEAGDRDL